MHETAEYQRLNAYQEREANWKEWGPYLSERAWGTVREDYSAGGAAWDYLPHDHARSRAYRWNEDGLAGISDRRQYLCFALALWNGQDPILKERLFGLTGPEGNHGEDVKEIYYYLDSTPTHSYMKMLYKYPQRAFPYADLVAENRRRGLHDFEYELMDTGIFAEDRYFDVFVEYAKATEEDVLVRVTAHNRGPEPAPLWLLPTLWFRNTWSWGYENGPMDDVPGKPSLHAAGDAAWPTVVADHPVLGRYLFRAEGAEGLLFTENETNNRRLFGTPNAGPYVKDAFHRALIEGERDAVNPTQEGTRAAAVYQREVPAGGEVTIRLRLTRQPDAHPAQRPADEPLVRPAGQPSPEALRAPFASFEKSFAARRGEADAFYAAIQAPGLTDDERRVQRQAFAGMLWSKQLYYIDVEQWLDGDPASPPPPPARQRGRNRDWRHLNNFDILSMPDKWEYPWYASWDLAFHCIPLAMVDPAFAKRQLILLTREWYMHPSGQLPAYEWAFGDANPPVHAWAAWHVYQIEAATTGQADRPFLEGIYHKLLLNFTWWVNREDEDGNNVFQGGFLGLDNISLFDRGSALPMGGHIDQSDGTAWMGFYSLGMLQIALELAREEPVYQDLATKFFEHFLAIGRAMVRVEGRGHALWNEEDGFFYDELHLPDDSIVPLKVRSLVGLIPLLAVTVLEPGLLTRMPDFERRVRWFLHHRGHLAEQNVAGIDRPGEPASLLVSILTRERLRSVLRVMLDENEFLSPYGIRSLSRAHAANPFTLRYRDETFGIDYQPAESRSGLFGGNSNWRGPIWMPINFLIIEALRAFDTFYGADFQVECPLGSGNWMSLAEVAHELARRLVSLFLRDDAGRRPVYGGQITLQQDPLWRDYLLFYEYFHGDNGAGLGASHQTGWTGLVAVLLQRLGELRA